MPTIPVGNEWKTALDAASWNGLRSLTEVRRKTRSASNACRTIIWNCVTRLIAFKGESIGDVGRRRQKVTNDKDARNNKTVPAWTHFWSHGHTYRPYDHYVDFEMLSIERISFEGTWRNYNALECITMLGKGGHRHGHIFSHMVTHKTIGPARGLQDAQMLGKLRRRHGSLWR